MGWRNKCKLILRIFVKFCFFKWINCGMLVWIGKVWGFFFFFIFNWLFGNRKRWNICISNGKLFCVSCNINFYFIQEDESVCLIIMKRKKGKLVILYFNVCKNFVLILLFFSVFCFRINILIRVFNVVFFFKF